MTHSAVAIRALLSSHGLAPRRERGQNFVGDPNTVRRIAALARVGPRSRVIEIGAGLGSLTLALAEHGAEITAIEVDRGLAGVLRNVIAEQGLDVPSPTGAPTGTVRVVEADAMSLDWSHDWTLGGGLDDTGPIGPVSVVANLPYNIATPLVADLLDGAAWIDRFLVMVQREVAERFTAAPRSGAYGAVSVKVAYWADARIVGHVPASVFVPRPRVDSSLVEIQRRPVHPNHPEPGPLFALVRRAFGQRRKMLRRSLAGVVSDAQFAAADVDPTARPEELDLERWCSLALCIAADAK